MTAVRHGRTLPVPKHLRDAHYQGSKRLEHGQGYQYPHDFPGANVRQDYLGVDKTYYQPVERGFEIQIAQRLKEMKEQMDSGDTGSAGKPG
jgi:putative ATPase